MRLYIVQLKFNYIRRKRYVCFADSENDAVSMIIQRWNLKNRQLINPPEIVQSSVIKSYPIKRGVLKSEK